MIFLVDALPDSAVVSACGFGGGNDGSFGSFTYFNILQQATIPNAQNELPRIPFCHLTIYMQNWSDRNNSRMSTFVSDNPMRRWHLHLLVRVSYHATRNCRQGSEASEALRAQKRKGHQKGKGYGEKGKGKGDPEGYRNNGKGCHGIMTETPVRITIEMNIVGKAGMDTAAIDLFVH